MEITLKAINFFNGTLSVPIPQVQFNNIVKLQQACEGGKELTFKLDVKRKRRSLDANAYMWVLLDDMAKVMHTDKERLYIEVLKRYGVFTHVVVKPNVVERVIRDWRAVEVVGDVTINGQKGTQLRCYFGSHSYDTKEFSRLLDGVISECKDLGIETRPREEIDQMLKEWGGE